MFVQESVEPVMPLIDRTLRPSVRRANARLYLLRDRDRVSTRLKAAGATPADIVALEDTAALIVVEVGRARVGRCYAIYSDVSAAMAGWNALGVRPGVDSRGNRDRPDHSAARECV